jgi:hypothetical protein
MTCRQGSGFAMASVPPLGYSAADMRIALLTLAALALLAGCGRREPLKPAAGQAPPPAPALSPTPPTTDEMLTPMPITRPNRQDDSLTKSQRREDDPFDLPPTG